jgi:predicted GNAT family acetyltransferase
MSDTSDGPVAGSVADPVAGVSRPIHLHRQHGRFVIDADGHRALLEFRLRGQVLSVLHTETPSELSGRGFANALARAALDWARAEGFTVKPYCPFTAGFIQRHPEFANLVDPAFHTPALD